MRGPYRGLRAQATLFRGLCIGVLCVVLVVGCTTRVDPADEAAESASVAESSGVPSTLANPYERDRAAGVQQLLDGFTEALLDGDHSRLATLVDPAAPARLRSAISAAADNFTSLTPIAFRYELAPTVEAERPIDSVLQAKVDEQGSSDSWLAPVQLKFTLGGPTPEYTEPPVTVNLQAAVARYGNGWRLIDLPGAPTQLWDIPGLQAESTDTAGGASTVLSYPGARETAASAEKLLADAEAAVSRFWQRQWQRYAVVVATAEEEHFAALVGAQDHDGAQVGAAAATTYVDLGTEQSGPVGQRIILAPAAANLDEAALAVVLRHEVFHVASRASTAPTAPMWLTEGVAEYIGRKGTYRRIDDAAPDLAAAVRQFGAPEAFPSPAEFADEGSRLAYQAAWSVAAFIAERFDEARLRALYVAAAGAHADMQDVAIMAALDMTAVDLVTEWRRWLDDQVR